MAKYTLNSILPIFHIAQGPGFFLSQIHGQQALVSLTRVSQAYDKDLWPWSSRPVPSHCTGTFGVGVPSVTDKVLRPLRFKGPVSHFQGRKAPPLLSEPGESGQDPTYMGWRD
jgi:hypothetical protein